jgi:hypothetical protein
MVTISRYLHVLAETEDGSTLWEDFRDAGVLIQLDDQEWLLSLQDEGWCAVRRTHAGHHDGDLKGFIADLETPPEEIFRRLRAGEVGEDLHPNWWKGPASPPTTRRVTPGGASSWTPPDSALDSESEAVHTIADYLRALDRAVSANDSRWDTLCKRGITVVVDDHEWQLTMAWHGWCCVRLPRDAHPLEETLEPVSFARPDLAPEELVRRLSNGALARSWRSVFVTQ